MQIHISPNKETLGKRAAKEAGQAIRAALATKDKIAIIVATGASQFEMLSELVCAPDIEWAKVTVFHLDEYIGIDDTHPASFRKYLRERFVAHLPSLGAFIPVDGSAFDSAAEIARLNEKIAAYEIDVCLAGIGENGHLAFNDPPADFVTKAPYLVVNLDEACRAQQLGEGWFASLEEVPKQAISMSIAEIMRAKKIILSVPDARKAVAVKNCLKGEVSPLHPASILQTHGNCSVFLDEASASLLEV